MSEDVDLALAYVLVNVQLGLEEDVKAKLMEIPEVEEAYRVYGVYDAILKLRADDEEVLKKLIFDKIRKIDGVRSTLTMIALES